jgi:hypothetical protein
MGQSRGPIFAESGMAAFGFCKPKADVGSAGIMPSSPSQLLRSLSQTALANIKRAMLSYNRWQDLCADYCQTATRGGS